MSDFKVGDVVVAKQYEEPTPVLGNGRKLTVAAAWVGECHGHCTRHQYVRLEEDGRHWDATRFSLVSRPSEGRPKKGDRVRIRAQKPGGPRGHGWVVAVVGATDHDPLCEGIRVRMDDTGSVVCCCFRSDVEVIPASEPIQAPALKVGDRVRVKGTQHVGDVVRHATPGWWGVVFNGANGDTRVIGYEADRLELLPPEPAPYALGTMLTIIDGLHPRHGQQGKVVEARDGGYVLEMRPGVTVHVLAGMVAEAPKPTTATEVSIKDPEYIHELDAMRYTLQPLWYVHPEVLKEMKPGDIKPGAIIPYDEEPTDFNPLPLPRGGWMPAGTYMPNKVTDVTRMRIPKTTIPYQADRFRDIPIPARARDMAYDGNHSLLVSTIPVPERRLSSRTNTYFNMGDEYDLLPDAE